jgi:hypothetical protein
MIIVKHLKGDLSSIIEIQLDRNLPLAGILSPELQCKFTLIADKRVFKVVDYTHFLLLDLLKDLRRNQWNLLTSNAFMHVSSERCVETNFYYIQDEEASPSSSSSESKRADLSSEYSNNNSSSSSNVGSTRERPITSDLATVILEKTASQSGPYSFARRSSLLNGK